MEKKEVKKMEPEPKTPLDKIVFNKDGTITYHIYHTRHEIITIDRKTGKILSNMEIIDTKDIPPTTRKRKRKQK